MKDSRVLSQVHSANSYPLPPPRYMESTAQTNSKIGEESHYGNSPWLLRRTSIVVESEPSEQVDDGRSLVRVSTCSTTKEDEKGALRGLLNKFGNRQGQERLLNGKRVEETNKIYETANFGTKVSIEASQPVRGQIPYRHEMRGLEQAASMKRWPGYGRKAEAWGKLMKVNACCRTQRHGILKRFRTPSCGIRLETPWCTLVTSDRNPHFESRHPSWKKRNRTTSSQSCRKVFEGPPNHRPQSPHMSHV